jgi:hypothetical protein
MTFQEKMQVEALKTAIFSIAFNLALLGGGVVLISAALGWQVGAGIGLLFMFLKGGMK